MTSTPSMSGRPEVEDDQVGAVAGAAAMSASVAGGGGVHLVVAGPQVDPQRAQDLRLVVDDEHPGHAAS